MAGPISAPALQVAALPWRLAGGGVEVLLVSSRETRRWVIPKGWPIPGLSHAEGAAREAFEEAGVRGRVSRKPIGVYRYMKRLDGEKSLECTVDVHPLRITAQLAEWPEKGERVVRWFHPTEAARLVQEPELAALIRSFAAGLYMRNA